MLTALQNVSIGGVTYVWVGDRLLRKDAFQMGLFGAEPEPVSLTPKAKQREKLQQQYEQGSLLDMSQYLKPKATAAPTGLKPKKAGKNDGQRKTVDGVTYELKNSRWRKVEATAPGQPEAVAGLQVIQDEPVSSEVQKPVEQTETSLKPKSDRPPASVNIPDTHDLIFTKDGTEYRIKSGNLNYVDQTGLSALAGENPLKSKEVWLIEAKPPGKRSFARASGDSLSREGALGALDSILQSTGNSIQSTGRFDEHYAESRKNAVTPKSAQPKSNHEKRSEQFVAEQLAKKKNLSPQQVEGAKHWAKEDHKRFIRNAHVQGKSIPAEVLGDYPGLAEEMGLNKPASTALPTTQPEFNSAIASLARSKSGLISLDDLSSLPDDKINGLVRGALRGDDFAPVRDNETAGSLYGSTEQVEAARRRANALGLTSATDSDRPIIGLRLLNDGGGSEVQNPVVDDSPKEGDRFLSPGLYGMHPDEFVLHSIKGDKAEVGYQNAPQVEIPASSWKHFKNDLSGKVDLPPSDNDDIQAVIDGTAKLLGKGNSGLAFRHEDKIIKVSTTVPFQPLNQGHRTPEEAIENLRQEHKIGERLREKNVPGILPSKFYVHGDKGFLVKPYLEVPTALEAKHLDRVEKIVHRLHGAGYSLRDQIQVGLLNGEAYLMDIGDARPLSSNSVQRKHEIEDDLSNLALLRRQSNNDEDVTGAAKDWTANRKSYFLATGNHLPADIKPNAVEVAELFNAKEGDRRTVNGKTYELRGGRWHRVDEVAKVTPDTTNLVDDASPQRLRSLAAEAGLTVAPNEDPEVLRDRLKSWIADGNEAPIEQMFPDSAPKQFTPKKGDRVKIANVSGLVDGTEGSIISTSKGTANVLLGVNAGGDRLTRKIKLENLSAAQDAPTPPAPPKPVNLDQLDDSITGFGYLSGKELDDAIASARAELAALGYDSDGYLIQPVNLPPSPAPEEPPAPAMKPALGGDVDYQTVSGQKTRLKINEQVRSLLAQGKDPASYTEQEKVLLAKYSGKGGLGDQTESINEYYTRPDIAELCVDILHQHGFEQGSVFEPSCGSGVFLGALNKDGVLPVGVEMDATSSACAAALNPHAHVAQATSFERFLIDNPDTQFEAVTGNVPFGTRIISSDMQASQYKLDKWKDAADLFVSESMLRLAPNGVMSLIVPRGVVSGAKHETLRQELMKQGRVVGVYRLPNTAFKHAGSPVVTDILVMQRHPDAVLNAIKNGDAAAIAATADHNFVGGGYFNENPDHILGTEVEQKRGSRVGTTVEGTVEAAIAKARSIQFEPTVSYEGLDVATDAAGSKVGDTKYINGTLYRLEGNPPRWHVVEDDHEAAAARAEMQQAIDPSAFGVESMAEASETLADVGKRVMIDPENLQAYLGLASEELSRAERAYMSDAAIALNHAGMSAERQKIAHAMLLAGHIKALQSGHPTDAELQQALGMLQRYRELHGNPMSDRLLKTMAGQFSQLFALQGAFDETGRISDYFADPEKVAQAIDRTAQSTAAAAMAEAFRANGGEPVGLEDIRAAYGGELGDDDLTAALLADSGVGYFNGQFQPLDRLLRGNGYELMDNLMAEAEALPEDSPKRRKLEEQIGTIRARLQPRAIEDMTTPFWAVGSWIPVDAFNNYMTDIGYDKVELTADGYEFVGEKSWHGGLESDILTWMNRGRISHGKDTKEAKDAVIAAEASFRDWLAGSDYRIEVEEAYNLAFTGDLPQDFSGEALDIDGIEQYDGDPENGIRKKRLHHYQNSTIRQMAEQGRGIVSLGVGLGKTATAIALSQYLKQVGRSQKPGIVVPKSVLANWVREIGFWGKDLNVMILGQTQQFWQNGEPAWEVPGHKFSMKGGNPVRDKDGNYVLFPNGDKSSPISMSEDEVKKRGNLAFSDDDAATKQRKLQQLSQNSYDLVLMSEPVFQDIPLDPNREFEYLDEIAGKHLNPDTKSTKDKSYKLQEQIETRKRKLAERRGGKFDADLITWEDLGIDCVLHDEAHHLKNLFSTGSRTGDVAFLSTAESNRALDFYYKSKYTRDQNNNQNVYLLTATPTTNNPLEAYNMLQHVCPEEFEKRGIQNVDDFLQMFGKIESVTVPGVDLEVTEKNGLVGFKNLKDLRHLFTKYCRMQSAKDVGLPIPEEKTHDVVVDMTEAQRSVYGSLRQRAQDLMKDGGGEGGEDDHIFSVISDMDKAAIDLDYYNTSKSDFGELADIDSTERSPKIQASVDRVMASRAANNGKQIVFCDAIQLHEDLKRQYVAAGYPENEIMIVNAGTAKKSSDRQKISQAYNDGRITLVIGNTATMGEGMNFQIGTTDIHHLTTPWTPAAIEQRNGRGVRQGNELAEVNCHYYHASKSFDLYRKGVLERKRGWIDELWKGDSDEADNQNTGALSMDELSVMMSDDPDAARQQLAANKELQLQRFKEKQTKASMRQFGQLQTMKLAIAKLSDEAKATQRGQELIDRYERAKGSLSRNEHFPHKALLDGGHPAYVGTDGTVIPVGGHVQKEDGSVWRVTAINNQTQKMQLSPVFGSDYRPFDFDQTKNEETEFKRVNARRFGVKPVDFNDEIRDRKLAEAVGSYKHIARLSPAGVDANREMFAQKIKSKDMGNYDYIPHINPTTGDVDVKYGKDLPEGAQILFPHDGDAEDKILRSWGKKIADGRANKDDYYYRQALEVMGKDMGYRSDDRPVIEQKLADYAAEHRASLEAARTPQEGDTRVNQAGHQEVLRNGRWVLAEQRPAASELQKPVAESDDADESALAGRWHQPVGEEEIAAMLKRSLPADKNSFSPSGLKAVSRRIKDSIYKFEADKKRTQEFVASQLDVAATLGHAKPLTDEERQATANAFVDALSAQASTPTASASPASGHPDPIGAIHQAIHALEDRDDDKGAERNDLGWSGSTRGFGSAMSKLLQAGGQLTPNQLRASLNMLNKHRKQLANAGINLPVHEDLKPFLGDTPSGDRTKGAVEHIGDAIAVTFPYDKATVAKIKEQVPGARWNKVDKRWEVPLHQFGNLLQAFPDFNVDDKLFTEERVFDAPPQQIESAGLIRADGNQIRVTFPYSRDLVGKVKSIKAAGRQAGKWNGREWEFPNNETVLEKLRAAFPEFDLAKSADIHKTIYSILGVPYYLGKHPQLGLALIRA